MLLTRKLLSFLNRVFDKDPGKFLAFRLSYEGGLTWRVENAVLYTTVTGGVGQNLTIDLAEHTIASLVGHLAGRPGYSVLYIDGTELAHLSARVLLDGANDIDTSNGDHVYGYTNVLWAYLEAAANELNRAKAAIVEMLRQMSTTTANDIWLDELGGYYGIPRLAGELDGSYGPRIIAEVLRPRENNVAMEAAIKTYTGQDAKVTDVVEWAPLFPVYDGAITHNSAETHNSVSDPRYGLFDVEYGYDLLSGDDFLQFQQVVRDLIGRLRAAGTHLRALALVGSSLADQLTPPDDGGEDQALSVAMPLGDVLTAPSESVSVAVSGFLSDAATARQDGASIVLLTNYTYSGLREHDGVITHRGNSVSAEDIGSPGDIPFTALLTVNGAFNLDGAQPLDGLI